MAWQQDKSNICLTGLVYLQTFQTFVKEDFRAMEAKNPPFDAKNPLVYLSETGLRRIYLKADVVSGKHILENAFFLEVEGTLRDLIA